MNNNVSDYNSNSSRYTRLHRWLEENILLITESCIWCSYLSPPREESRDRDDPLPASCLLCKPAKHKTLCYTDNQGFTLSFESIEKVYQRLCSSTWLNTLIVCVFVYMQEDTVTLYSLILNSKMTHDGRLQFQQKYENFESVKINCTQSDNPACTVDSVDSSNVFYGICFSQKFQRYSPIQPQKH